MSDVLRDSPSGSGPVGVLVLVHAANVRARKRGGACRIERRISNSGECDGVSVIGQNQRLIIRHQRSMWHRLAAHFGGAPGVSVHTAHSLSSQPLGTGIVLRLTTLGGLSIGGEATPAGDVRPRRLALLAILAAAGAKGISREQILAILWAESEPGARAAQSVANAVQLEARPWRRGRSRDAESSARSGKDHVGRERLPSRHGQQRVGSCGRVVCGAVSRRLLPERCARF